MALLGSPMTGPAPRAPQTPPPTMPGQRVMNAAYAPAASNPAAAVHAAMSRFAPSQPSLFHFLAAAAAAHPSPQIGQRLHALIEPQAQGIEGALHGIGGGGGIGLPAHHPVHAPSGEEPNHGFLPPQADSYAQLLPLLRALVPNPNFSY